MPRFLDLPAAILLHIGLMMIAFAIMGSALVLVTSSIVATGAMRLRPNRRMRASAR